MFDFAVGARREGYKVTRNGVTLQTDSSYMFLNDKGIVTRNRKVKKDAFYLYKACWNHNEPTIYITSRRYAERTSDTLVIKVYSNLLTSSLKNSVFYNWLINSILCLCVPSFWGTQKIF